MADIGATLREARMRQRIDISELEAQTKIRAKYLRALENEEWDLLPGATFVKSFLRTYAEALGLDARAIIEEYKLDHERLSEHELLPIAPPSGRNDRRRRGPPPGLRRDVAVALLVVALVGLLIILGRHNSADNTRTQAGNPTATNSTSTTPAHHRKHRGQHGSTAQALARLRLVPSGPVWVCLQAAGKRTLIAGRIIGPGSALPVYRSKQFKMTFGNGNLVMRINGRSLSVPDVQNAISYTVDHRGHRTTLPAGQGPTCA